jgi:hypothetical protein
MKLKESDMNWFIALGDISNPRKFFNRETQGFTDVAPVSAYKERGANRLANSGEPYKIWTAMCENDPNLVLWWISEEKYIENFA